MYYLTVSAANTQIITLTLTYEPASTNPRYNVTLTQVEGGALAASATRAEEGTEITLTATPDDGYEFNNDWMVKAEDNSEIAVVDGKFTLPAQNVSVTATFSKIEYAITANAAEHGSYTVKLGDAEVTKATIGDKITLEYTAEEGWLLNSWTVVKTGTEEAVTVTNDAFYMPAAAVTITANVVEADKVPVYASLAELVAAGAPTETEAKVTVTFTNEKIVKFHTSLNSSRIGIILTSGTQEVEVYCPTVPASWEIGGTVSGTLTECKWVLYGNAKVWELAPTSWDELTYTEPNKLTVDPTSKTWAADATDEATFTVTSNGTWTVTPTTLDWATITTTANTITVTPNGANESESAREATLTVTHSADASLTQTITLKQLAAGQTEEAKAWVLTPFADLAEGDEVVIVRTSGTTYALPNNGGASKPSVKAVSVVSDRLSTDPDASLIWIVGISGDKKNFYKDNAKASWLYCLDNNDGVRVGTGTNKDFSIYSGYLANAVTSSVTRYIGIYNDADWRCYNNITGNTKDQTFGFFVHKSVTPVPVESVSINEVAPEVQVGKTTPLSVTFNPSNANSGTELSWSSSDESVATVNSKGEVTGVAEGTATITVTSANGRTDSVEVMVTEAVGGQISVLFEVGKDTSTSASISKDDVTISFSSGTFSRTDNYRLYSGQTMTVSVPKGKLITKIETVEVSGNQYLSGDGFERSDANGVWNGSANSVRLTASGGQSRMTSIKVTFE